MKKLTFVFAAAILVASCGEKKEVKTETEKSDMYAVFGDSISDKDVLSNAEMMAKYETLKEGDTVSIKFSSKINDVCQKKDVG